MAKKLKEWFDKELAQMLAQKIAAVYKDFDSKRFISEVEAGVSSLELKNRIELFADIMHELFAIEYPGIIKIFLKIMGPENKNETGMFTEFYWLMPIAKYVEKYGVDYFAESMKVIEEITKRNTGEWTIRPFIEKYPRKTIKQMITWSKSDNFHLRRLASEGVRTRLPWAKKLNIVVNNPSLVLGILENLKDDKCKYVQRSVANNINDLVKDDKGFAVKLLEDWGVDDISKERAWIIKHASRNLK